MTIRLVDSCREALYECALKNITEERKMYRDEVLINVLITGRSPLDVARELFGDSKGKYWRRAPNGNATAYLCECGELLAGFDQFRLHLVACDTAKQIKEKQKVEQVLENAFKFQDNNWF